MINITDQPIPDKQRFRSCWWQKGNKTFEVCKMSNGKGGFHALIWYAPSQEFIWDAGNNYQFEEALGFCVKVIFQANEQISEP